MERLKERNFYEMARLGYLPLFQIQRNHRSSKIEAHVALVLWHGLTSRGHWMKRINIEVRKNEQRLMIGNIALGDLKALVEWAEVISPPLPQRNSKFKLFNPEKWRELQEAKVKRDEEKVKGGDAIGGSQ